MPALHTPRIYYDLVTLKHSIFLTVQDPVGFIFHFLPFIVACSELADTVVFHNSCRLYLAIFQHDLVYLQSHRIFSIAA